MSERSLPGKPGAEGFALFLVLWVLMFLSVIVGEFCYAMRTELNIARNFKEETQAYYAARAGLCQGLKMVIENELRPQEVVRTVEEELLGEEGEEPERVRINVSLPAAPFGRAKYELMIGNESGKVNLNQAQAELLMMMLNGFEMDDEDREVIVDSIQDWRDEDDFHRVNGAETDYYKSQRPAYEAKNGPFDSIEELLLVKGVTPELFYGGLKDLVTVYPSPDSPGSRSRRRGMAGDANRININAASPQMLLALPEMTEELVLAVLEYRESQDFLAESDIVGVVGPDVYQAIQPFVTLSLNPYYSLTATGLLPDSRVRQSVEMLVEIDSRYPKQYRVVRWIDGVR